MTSSNISLRHVFWNMFTPSVWLSSNQSFLNNNIGIPCCNDSTLVLKNNSLFLFQDISPANSPSSERHLQNQELNSAPEPSHGHLLGQGYQSTNYDAMDYDSSNDSDEEINVT